MSSSSVDNVFWKVLFFITVICMAFTIAIRKIWTYLLNRIETNAVEFIDAVDQSATNETNILSLQDAVNQSIANLAGSIQNIDAAVVTYRQENEEGRNQILQTLIDTFDEVSASMDA